MPHVSPETPQPMINASVTDNPRFQNPPRLRRSKIEDGGVRSSIFDPLSSAPQVEPKRRERQRHEEEREGEQARALVQPQRLGQQGPQPPAQDAAGQRQPERA